MVPYLSSGSELIEDMIVSLLGGLGCDSGLFQKVILDDTALDFELGVEADLHEPSEPRGVVIPDRLGIAWNGEEKKAHGVRNRCYCNKIGQDRVRRSNRATT